MQQTTRQYREAIQNLGRDDVTATFGVAPPAEIVGPLKPDAVYYGQAFGYDEHHEEFRLHDPVPLVTFSFNKYRSDLPPWRNCKELVLAARGDGGTVYEYTFIDTNVRGINTTGNLKTVEMSGLGPSEGVDAHIIDREEIR